ncbi:hypothetical protein V6R21_32145 [Limibacter armeniacum]|uniref:hypothetical protein n=1 Tax=Limibacter armeniacum TaxID=466084 RepID=UPI002FE606CA
MKYLLLFIFCCCFQLKSFAQIDEVKMIQTLYGMEKKAIVEEFMNLSEPDASVFWDIYASYEAERRENGRRVLETLNEYTQNYNVMDDAKADKFIQDVYAIDNVSDKISKKYYKKVKKALGAQTAAKFTQIESYIKTAVRLEVMENLPFIDELTED